MSRDFDGVDDKIDCGSAAVIDNLANADLSCVAWVYPDSMNTNNRIMQKRGSGTGNPGWIFHVRSTAALGFITADSAGADAQYVSSNSSLSANVWSHVAAVYTFSSKTAKLYINGVETSYLTQIAGNGTSFDDSDTALVIGRSNTGAETVVFDGKIAYCQLIARALSINEINYLMRYPGSLFKDTKGFWPLWGVASPEGDYSGNANSGTVTGAVAGTTDPPVNNVFYPRCPNLYYSAFGPSSETVTVDKWFKETERPKVLRPEMVAY